MSSISPNNFSIDLFDHPLQLERFMSGDEALNQIKKIANAIKHPSKDNLYFGRWKIVWICVKAPFEWIFSCFTWAIASIFECLNAKCLSRYFTILTEHMNRDSEQLAHQWRYQKSLLVPSINTPQIGAWDAYQYGDISIHKIKNKNLLNFTFFKLACDEIINFLLNITGAKEDFSQIKIKFFQLVLSGKVEMAIEMLIQRFSHKDGEKIVRGAISALFNEQDLPLICQIPFFRPRMVCKGATHWFIHLFIHSLKSVCDLESCAIAVAEQFRSGVPSQGILLQVLSNRGAFNLLHRTSTFMEKHSITNETSRSHALATIESLPPGVYKVNVYQHTFAYIKTGQTKDFVFNPSFGLLHLTSDEMLDMVNTFYCNLYNRPPQGKIHDLVYDHFYKNNGKYFLLSFEQIHPFEPVQEDVKVN